MSNSNNKINCPNCKQSIFIQVNSDEKLNPLNKLFKDVTSNINGNNFIPRIFFSIPTDYPLSITRALLKDDKLRSVLFDTHKLNRKNYIQVGRFVPVIDNSSISVNSYVNTSGIINDGDVNNEIWDKPEQEIHQQELEREAKAIIPSLIYSQIKKSHLMYAVITGSGQHNIVAEIQYALACSVPVFLKFCNCNEYHILEYWFIISAVRHFMNEYKCKLKTLANVKEFPSQAHFLTINVLTSWKNLDDYLNYLNELDKYDGELTCESCHHTCSPNFKVRLSDIRMIDDDFEIDDYKTICYDCANNLKKVIEKTTCLNEIGIKLVFEYFGLC